MYAKYGLAPGTTKYTGQVELSIPKINYIGYNEDVFDKKNISFTELSTYACETDSLIHWYHIEPISDAETIADIANSIALHPLVTEDILSVDHRPKVDEYSDYLFIILNAIDYQKSALTLQHISFVIKDYCLFTFSDLPMNFTPLIDRIQKKSGRIRSRDTGYLFFAIADLIVDNYFKVLETIDEELETLEEEILNNPSKESVARIHQMKRTLITMRHSIWPLREIINTMMNSNLSSESNHLYFKDLYDHTIHILDMIEGYRDTVSGFLDIYLSTMSNRMNEIMKTLSIIATIFIPLSFITGYFGMNFKYQTILESKSIYILSNIMMVTMPVLMLVYFKIRKWF